MARSALRFKIRKFPNLAARLAPWDDDDRFTRGVLLPIAFEVERGAKKRAPVDTGRLKTSLGVAWKKKSSAAIGKTPPRGGGPIKRSEAVSQPSRPRRVWVGTAVEYATKVHETHPSKAKYLEKSVREARARAREFGKRFAQRGR